MLHEIVARAQGLAVDGNHITWAANKVAQAMTNQEIMDFANELNDRRTLSSAHAISTGTHRRTGEVLSKLDIMHSRQDFSATVVSYVTTIHAGREWR